MKRIYYAELNKSAGNAYQMGEIDEAEYGHEWNGNVAGYLANLTTDEDLIIEETPELWNIYFGSFGSLQDITNLVLVSCIDSDGEKIPKELWFSAEDSEPTYWFAVLRDID